MLTTANSAGKRGIMGNTDENLKNERENEQEEPKTSEKSEPEKSFTQSDVDAMIAERLKSERRKHAEELAKYADYDALKEKAGKFDELDEANKSEAQRLSEAVEAATKRAEQAESELARLTAKAEHDELVAKVAREEDVDAWLLQGETEEELVEFARRVKKLEESRKPKPPSDEGGAPAYNSGRGSKLSEREERALRAR